MERHINKDDIKMNKSGEESGCNTNINNMNIFSKNDEIFFNNEKCYIVQEIPFNDFYNYNYERIRKFDKLEKESYNINGNTYSCDNTQTSTNSEYPTKIQFNKYIQKEKQNNQSICNSSVNSDENNKDVEKNKVKKIKLKNEFLKQCEFNNDGSCYYTISSKNKLQLYATDITLLNIFSNGNKNNNNILENLYKKYKNMSDDEIERRNSSWINMNINGHIYDCKFYPYFDWNNNNTCFFALTSKDVPVKIYSAYDGSPLISFKLFNESQELSNCYSLCFHPEKNWLLCGTKNRSIKVYDLNKPNEIYENRILGTRKGKGQKGIISTIDYKKEGYGNNSIYAIGDYNDILYIYADNCNHKNDYILKFSNKYNSNGITCVKWYGEYNILSGNRNGSYIYLYDIRNNKEHVHKFNRYALTNQKYLFDVHKNYIISGDTFGYLNFYNIENNELVHKQLINKYSPIVSVNVHSTHPFILTGSGTRRFYENWNSKIDISCTSPIYNNTNIHEEISFKAEQDDILQHFPSKSHYINSVCTIFCKFLCNI
ncbi:WD repeat-containing protein 79, putative [Plasmodium berghei]|uniref:WD repeat-containing protein 79, putative n=2 Tax=Plasmodium berghei TaxID=5821 RepID=A0A509AS24_PLABA|nr:WD repeat-containing protein 79, putative [Plasmodium berghei ANKA]SCL97236.1 WD repeat-containing protein 79, putative [Plasmodium berghei]SCM16580.1 WD repeat-containing protein 79, putative [Plasmodium berghei]SCN27807.1 WD repeat-containing protein 79, putative [Plasmodium berghei]VUC57691.1 WD repeat-containing protein 79, putative [Plasmodium berghei ANKA]|eukprot:XP_034423461.1 WD repeat-containing protein 79, putative [Plasmodium berghei ANKA]